MRGRPKFIAAARAVTMKGRRDEVKRKYRTIGKLCAWSREVVMTRCVCIHIHGAPDFFLTGSQYMGEYVCFCVPSLIHECLWLVFFFRWLHVVFVVFSSLRTNTTEESMVSIARYKDTMCCRGCILV